LTLKDLFLWVKGRCKSEDEDEADKSDIVEADVVD